MKRNLMNTIRKKNENDSLKAVKTEVYMNSKDSCRGSIRGQSHIYTRGCSRYVGLHKTIGDKQLTVEFFLFLKEYKQSKELFVNSYL